MDSAEHPDDDLEDEPRNEVDIYISHLDGTLDDGVGEETAQVRDEDSYDENYVKVFLMKSHCEKTPSEKFEGECVDSWTQNKDIGINQSKAYWLLVHRQFFRSESKGLIFKFGSHQRKEMEIVNIRITISNSLFLYFQADLVYIDVTLLLGLKVLTSSRIILNFLDGEVPSKTDGW